MKVVYAERARQDILAIFDFISDQSPSTALRIESAIRANCERLADFPYAAASTDEPDVYRLPLVRYPFVIFYRVNEIAGTVEIARVLHGARVKSLRRLPDDDT